MKNNLTPTELKNLIQTVFQLKATDKRLVILVDVPDDRVPDNPHWQERRRIASYWAAELNQMKVSLGLEQVNLFYYPNVHNNNADLPERMFTYDESPEQLDAALLKKKGHSLSLTQVLAEHQIILAPTEFSATAPLKLSAGKYGFRAATMPGFSNQMIPALRLDYQEINQRVLAIKKELDQAVGADIQFAVEGGKSYQVHLDLRFRTAHASSGRFPEPGLVGNLPSGECYIVPYEGEKGEKSRSAGSLPVQFENEVVLYRIENNRAIAVLSKGVMSTREASKLHEEPAYGNMAELGFGVLRDFGIQPMGELLLDEKLGLHIAFGRSDHFGGIVGVKNFHRPENVVHIDRIYIPETQNRVLVDEVKLIDEDGLSRLLMKDGEYQIFGSQR